VTVRALEEVTAKSSIESCRELVVSLVSTDRADELAVDVSRDPLAV